MSFPGATSDAELDAFLLQYGATNVRCDADALASLWGLPGVLIEADGIVKGLFSHEDVIAAVSPAHPIYERLGVSRCEHTVLERVDLTDAVVRTRVRWHFSSPSDEHLTDVDFEYVLRNENRLLLHVGVAIDVASKFRELAQRKGVELG